MFENNADFEFDDNLQVTTTPKEIPRAPTKRPSPQSPDESNKRPKITSTKLPKNVITRKFPGPAGLLPDRKDFNFSVSEPPHSGNNDDILCSQMSLSVFQSGPWLEMSGDYSTLLETFNIKWIKNKARTNKLHNQKAPFLAAIIQNIECFDEKIPTVNVVLKDTSGEIQGTIIHSLYEEYANNLILGAVIVLKQFGVLTNGSNNNHCLTITQNNLVAIYVKEIGDKVNNEMRIIKIQNIESGDFIRNLNPVQTMNNEKMPENKDIFDDEFTIPDNFEECLIKENKIEEKKFNFKKTNVVVNCSQISVNTNEEDSKIWQNALEDVDADSLFEDF